jgi:hypothetical protein
MATKEYKEMTAIDLLNEKNDAFHRSKEVAKKEIAIQLALEKKEDEIAKKIKERIVKLPRIGNSCKVESYFVTDNMVVYVQNYNFNARYSSDDFDTIIEKNPETIEGIELSILVAIEKIIEEVLEEEGIITNIKK